MSRGGQLIREARKRAGLTQREVAERIGTTQSAIARWENNGAAPSLDTVVDVLRALGFDLDYMLVEDDPTDRIQAARAYSTDRALHVSQMIAWSNRLAATRRRFVDEAASRSA